MATLPAVVFDLGNVLLNFTLKPFAQFVERHGRSFEGAKELYESIGGTAYEHGKLPTDEFVRRIQQLLPQPASTGSIAAAWNEIFVANEPMIALLRQCKNSCPVYILSNSNELHWDYVCRTFGIEKEVDDAIASHHVGFMKPAPQIYAIAEERFSLTPDRTIFIDDRLENVEGAQAAGWHGVHHIDFSTTKHILAEFGLPV